MICSVKSVSKGQKVQKKKGWMCNFMVLNVEGVAILIGEFMCPGQTEGSVHSILSRI